jgi:hypothetical protein
MKAFKWLVAVFIALSGDDIRSLISLISLTLFRDEQEHCSSCNNATCFILRFIKF